jgi:hypothetical protein
MPTAPPSGVADQAKVEKLLKQRTRCESEIAALVEGAQTDLVHAAAIHHWIGPYSELDKHLASAELRRNNALREIEFWQQGMAQRLSQVLDDYVIEGERADAEEAATVAPRETRPPGDEANLVPAKPLCIDEMKSPAGPAVGASVAVGSAAAAASASPAASETSEPVAAAGQSHAAPANAEDVSVEDVSIVDENGRYRREAA